MTEAPQCQTLAAPPLDSAPPASQETSPRSVAFARNCSIESRGFGAAATIGERERQEDEWGVHVDPPTVEGGAKLLAVLADGMGGAPAGDCASRTVVSAFLDSYVRHAEPAPERLQLAAWGANDAVAEAVRANQALDGMGATLVAALFFANRCEWLSVGDSYLFLYRNAQLSRLNPLHIYATELDAKAQRGEITREAALAHPDRHQLTSVVMGWPIEQMATGTLGLHSGDMVLLASDGLATLSSDEVAAICAEGAGHRTQAQWIADALLRRIEEHQAQRQDNATAIVALPNSET